MLKSTRQASVPRDAFPPTPPGPEGSNGNGLLRVQWVSGAWLFIGRHTAAGIALLTPSSWTLKVLCLKIISLHSLPEKSTSEPTRARQDQRPRHLCPASPVDERRPRKNGRNLE